METEIEKAVAPVEVDYEAAIREVVENYHVRAYKIDVRKLWETAWRVNVYFANDGIVREITMPYTYFVKVDSDKSLLYTPNLGVKS